MRTISVIKKFFIFICILAIVSSGCNAQTEKCVQDSLCVRSAHSVLQVPKARTELPDMLDEGQWMPDDDVATQTHLNNRKMGTKVLVRLLLFNSLLTGLSALFSHLFAGIFHDSSCHTRGLSRILAFILDTDGQKDNLSFYFI